MKPIIGVLLRPEISPGCYNVMCVYEKLSTSIIKNGGIPIGIYPPTIESYYGKDYTNTKCLKPTEINDLIQIINMCDGIICQGGDDYYDYEIQAIKYAHSKNIPLLGICLGMQAMAIAFNGEVKEIGNSSHHKKGVAYVHSVNINENSNLFKIVNKVQIQVNSRHKWCVVKTDLDVVGITDNNIIEAIEDKTKDFFIGVQWHPETMSEYDPIMNNLFCQFILRTKKYN